MGLKKQIRKTVDNVKDTARETKHRAESGAERAKRESFGQDMTATQKVRSAGRQAKSDVQADWDKTKRDIRKKT